MELVNGLPKSIKLGKRWTEIDGDEKTILRDNGGVTVATLRQDRTFSDSFNKALESRYNLHAELVGALEELFQWAKSVQGHKVSHNITEYGEIFKEAKALLKRARGEA